MTLQYGLLLMSFFVGLLIGLTSMGGAALMTPFLILMVGVRPVLAVGTDLAYGALTKIFGAALHWKFGTVDLRIVLLLAMGSIPGGISGVLLLGYLNAAGFPVDDAVRQAIGAALVMVAVVVLATSLGWVPDGRPALLKRYRTPATVAWGALVGFAVGLTSVGSGSLITPFLLMLYPSHPSRAVGTDVAHAAILVSATAFMYSRAGHVDWQLVPTLLAGSLPGVVLGSYLGPRMPARTLRVGLSMVLFATGIKLL